MPLRSTTTPVGLTVLGAPPEPLSIPKQDTKAAQVSIASLSPPNGEEVEILQASIKAGSVAQIVVAVIAVIGLVYLLKLVMVTTFLSILLAFVLEPLVSRLARIG